jgi:hypothetical protein
MKYASKSYVINSTLLKVQKTNDSRKITVIRTLGVEHISNLGVEGQDS